MPRFEVTLEQTKRMYLTMEVDAPTEDEAIEKALQLEGESDWKDGEYERGPGPEVTNVEVVD